MDKNSFLMYLDYEEQFNLLSNEEIGILMRAIMQYEKTHEIPTLNGVLKMAFSFIKTQLDRDREKYNKKCEKNKENGAKGGRPKKPNGFEETEGLNEKPKKPDNDNDDDDVDDNEGDNVVVDEEELQKQFIKCIGSTNINAIEECISYLNDLPYEVIDYALVKASRVNNPNWKYAKTILDDWVKREINTLEKVKVEELAFKNQKSETQSKPKQTNYNNYEKRNYGNLNDLYANGGG